MDITVGATLTGGSTVVLNPAGLQPGKSTYTAPGHSRLTPKVVSFTVSSITPTAKEPGVARSGMQISLSGQQTEEGCCTVQKGLVAIDIGTRWHLNQPESLVDDAIELLQALVFKPEFAQAMKAGVLPSA